MKDGISFGERMRNRMVIGKGVGGYGTQRDDRITWTLSAWPSLFRASPGPITLVP